MKVTISPVTVDGSSSFSIPVEAVNVTVAELPCGKFRSGPSYYCSSPNAPNRLADLQRGSKHCIDANHTIAIVLG